MKNVGVSNRQNVREYWTKHDPAEAFSYRYYRRVFNLVFTLNVWSRVFTVFRAIAITRRVTEPCLCVPSTDADTVVPEIPNDVRRFQHHFLLRFQQPGGSWCSSMGTLSGSHVLYTLMVQNSMASLLLRAYVIQQDCEVLAERTRGEWG
jgi:hypothetical protein